LNPFKRLMLAIARSRLSSSKLGEGSQHPLEDWICAKVAATAKKEPELRGVIGRIRPEEVDLEALQEYQLFKVRHQMRYTMENSYYYKHKLSQANLRPSDIRDYEDLLKIPITEPKELAEDSMGFLCVSQTKVMRAFTTSGTSGTRKRLFYTRGDVLNIVDAIAAALKDVGMRKDDTLQIMFPTVASWDPGLMLESACKVAGLKAVNASTIDIDEQMRIMREKKSTMMIGLTSFLYRLTVLAREKHDLRGFNMKAIICSAEPLPEAMRHELEQAWGCKALSQYGMTEMGLATTIECYVQDGMHIDAADYLAEVVDPVTGEHVNNRVEGELIWTSLCFEGSPLIRYRSYDVSMRIDPPCSCGIRAVGKIGKIKGRMDMQSKVGLGDKVYPYLFDEAVLKVHGVLGYHAIIEKAGYKDLLRFKVEYMGDPKEGKRMVEESLLALDEFKLGIENDLLEPPLVEVVPPDQEHWVPKSLTLIDKRKQFD
jgi:phenylacetate-CoA ligase